MRVAKVLGGALRRHTAIELTLVDQFDYHQIITELHAVAAASMPPEAAAIPFSELLAGKPVTFIQTKVTGFNFQEQTVATESGKLSYDILVIALGSETDFFGIEGLREHSLTLKSLPDALRLKEHVNNMFALAKNEPNAEARRRLLTFVVGGGGFTGTELAGELADRLRDLGRETGIPTQESLVAVVEAGPTLLSGFDPGLVRKARIILEGKGVELHLGDRVVRAEPGTLELKGGQVIHNRTLVWTGGVKANELVQHSGLRTGVRGRVVVNPYLQTVDFANVYAVGDVALVLNQATGQPLAPSAQLALQEANIVARNIQAGLSGSERVQFQPRIAAEVVSVGRKDALAKVGPFGFDGRPAHWLKRMALLRYLYTVGGPPLVGNWLMRHGLGGD